MPVMSVGVDEHGQPGALLVEGELGDVAEDQLLAGGQFAEDEVPARPLFLFAGLALGDGFVEGDPAGVPARELDRADLVVFHLLARFQVDDGRLEGRGLLLLAELLGLLGVGIDDEGAVAGVAREPDEAHPAFAGRELVFLRALDLLENDFAVAFRRSHAIGQPFAVGREARVARAAPAQDILELDGAGRLGRGLLGRRRGGLGERRGGEGGGQEQEEGGPFVSIMHGEEDSLKKRWPILK